MTKLAIQEQVNALKFATQEALRSKAASLKILIDAGIIQCSQVVKSKYQARVKNSA